MKYRVYASDRWAFNETYRLSKDDVTISLEFNMKSGSVIVEAPEGYDFGEEFDSRDFAESDVNIEETGDENLEDWEVYADDEETVGRVNQEIEEEYDEESDDYFDFRDYLEQQGWEYVSHDVYISEIGVEEYEEFD